MKKYISSEDGSYTVEASVSLVFFLFAVMFIFSQIRVLIGESIMQNAVNNMAKEVASYVYILDRVGVIIDHSKDEQTQTDQLVNNVQDTVAQFTTLLDSVFKSEKTDASSFVESIKEVMKSVQNMDKETLISDIKTDGKNAAESLVKIISNEALKEFYNWKLDAYLPMERDKFCQYFMIDKSSISFGNSRVFPSDDNNTVFVIAEYDTISPIKSFETIGKRHVAKYAYTAAWVSSNAH